MALENQANQDFEKAIFKAFWRKILAWLTRSKDNNLLPFDEVRQRLPFRGQHYLGLKEVPVNKIVGSMGRYLDFDRAFLPIQKRTKDRWVNIDIAHLSQLTLPAVELYKMGDIYFVKDGNHRVSVARERGQEFVDAFVTEIVIPVPLTSDLSLGDLDLKLEYARFIEQTGLNRMRGEAVLESSVAGQYSRLLEHISVHRWFLGEQRSAEVPYSEAVTSWYDSVYQPLAAVLREYNLVKEFPGITETDLYVWVMEYQGHLRELFREDGGQDGGSNLGAKKEEAFRQLAADYPVPAVRKLVNLLRRVDWVDNLVLQQEWAAFNQKTRLNNLRPGARVLLSLPVLYSRLLEHIDVHRWYLGEHRQSPANYEEAVASWYDNVYQPLVNIIRELDILAVFAGRTETDLYLWVIEHQAYLQLEYGSDVSIEQAVEQFSEDFSPRKKKHIKRGGVSAAD
jgi:hypothetical protein